MEDGNLVVTDKYYKISEEEERRDERNMETEERRKGKIEKYMFVLIFFFSLSLSLFLFLFLSPCIMEQGLQVGAINMSGIHNLP